VDVLIALGVLVVLGVVVVGFVRWARGGAPYDDGTGAMDVPYVPEPNSDESAPPPEPDHVHERRDDGDDE